MGQAASRVFRAVAGFDLAVTWPRAVPGLASHYVDAFAAVDRWLGLGSAVPRLDPMGLLFVNLAGVLCVCWNGARTFGHGRALASIDIGGRIAVATLAVLYVGWGVSPVVLVFFVTEIGGAVLQWRALGRPTAA